MRNMRHSNARNLGNLLKNYKKSFHTICKVFSFTNVSLNKLSNKTVAMTEKLQVLQSS